MDLAKILSPTSSLDEVSNNVTSKKYHLTVVPTTFATGSEHLGAIYKSVEGVKQAVRGEEIIPDEVIYDPKIFLTLNERLLVCFFDLFTHAFETGLSKKEQKQLGLIVLK